MKYKVILSLCISSLPVFAQENNNNNNDNCPYKEILSKAIFHKNLKLFHQLLVAPYNEDCSYKDYANRNPLHIALIHNDDEDMATTLLDHNIDFNYPESSTGGTVLHYAITKNKSSEFLAKLLELKKIDLESRNKAGRTAMHEALIADNLAAVTLLQRYGASINYTDEHGITPLFKAISSNNQKLFNTLLAYAANVRYQDKYQRTALHHALLYAQDEQMICDLIKADPANADVQDNDGKIPLHWVMIQKRSNKIVDLLIEKTNNLNVEDNAGHAPIHKAVLHSFIAGIEALIKAGVSVNLPTHSGLTPLLLLFQVPVIPYLGGAHASIKPLVLCGADPNQQDAEGNTPLHVAAKNNYGEHAKQLLLCGAVKNIKNNAGKIPHEIGNGAVLKVIEEY